MTLFVVADAAGTILYQASTVLSWEDVVAHWSVPAGAQAVQVDAWVQDRMAWRVVDGAVVERAAMSPVVSTTAIAADGVVEAVISGLPDPCRVMIDGPAPIGPTIVEGGTLTITASQPGAWRVRVEADPVYQPWSVTIDAS